MERLDNSQLQLPEQPVSAEPAKDHNFLRRAGLAVGAGILSISAVMGASPAEALDRHELPSQRGENTDESFRLGSFNILGAFHRGNIDYRARVASELIMGKRNSTGKVSIVGLQEVDKPQKPLFDKYLEGYESVPKQTHKKANSRAYIYYEKERFDLLKNGIIKHPFYGDRGLNRGGEAVWGKFQDKETGRIFYMINSHSTAWNADPGSDSGGALKREKTAEIIDAFVDKIEQSSPEEVDVFKVGDDNSTTHRRLKPGWRSPRPNKDKALNGNDNRLPYYIYTQKDGPGVYNLQDSLDVYEGRRGHGPDKRHTWLRDNTVDFVYVPGSGWQVSDWDKIQNDIPSDHYLINVEVSPINNDTAN